MTYVLKKGQRLEDILPVNKSKKVTNGKKQLDAQKYVGKIKFKGDPVKIQKQMRDEWG